MGAFPGESHCETTKSLPTVSSFFCATAECQQQATELSTQMRSREKRARLLSRYLLDAALPFRLVSKWVGLARSDPADRAATPPAEILRVPYLPNISVEVDLALR